MAVRNKKDNEKTAEENTVVVEEKDNEKTVEENTVVVEEKDNEKTVEEKEEVIAYIGPHIPKFGIMKNMVYRGKRSDTIAFLSPVLEFAPEAENLLIDLKDVATKQKELLGRNTKLYEYYESIENKVRGDK